MENKDLEKLCRLLRYDILTSTTAAGSGHPSSCLSSVELLATLFFGGFYKADDRFILSKGHAAPLIYSLYHRAGLVNHQELMSLRKFGSPFEGHPNPRFPYVDVATGSLGQGLSVGVGMAMGIKLKQQPNHHSLLPKVWVLMGDSEMAEGQVWEAIEIAPHYGLNNLVGIIDVNRLGQNGETLYGWKVEDYVKRISAFGWNTITIKDGHNLVEISQQLTKTNSTLPTMIIARTVKGKGVSQIENKDGWHGKPLSNIELETALNEIGKDDQDFKVKICIPTLPAPSQKTASHHLLTLGHYPPNTAVATREAYGAALAELGLSDNKIVVLDAEVGNSTYHNLFKEKFPDRFFQFFIAEQNMVSAALGFDKVGYVPFVSTFAAFLTRAFDQIRMSQYSNPNIKIVGSHAGVSIGQDGPSQMGLEDLAMLRSIAGSTVFYPSDAVSTAKLTGIMAETHGLFYMRTTRGKTPVIYSETEKFKIGGLKIHKSKVGNPKSKCLIIAAGITLHEALKAQRELATKDIGATVVDLYCVKPLDVMAINRLVKEHQKVIVVEDHFPEGGIGEAISSLLTISLQPLVANLIHLCVRKTPMSGSPEELLHYEEIDSVAILSTVKDL